MEGSPGGLRAQSRGQDRGPGEGRTLESRVDLGGSSRAPVDGGVFSLGGGRGPAGRTESWRAEGALEGISLNLHFKHFIAENQYSFTHEPVEF